jgi:uncharacterized Zn-finger protein
LNKLHLEKAAGVATIGGKSTRIQPLSDGPMATACKHPRVRIVSRHEDTEFVECLECGEVFDAEEFNDMAIEESGEADEQATTDDD